MDDTLILLANEVRKKTLWLLDGVTDEMARFVAPGLANSILWHAGHALVVVEHLGVVPASGGPPVLPAGWFEKSRRPRPNEGLLRIQPKTGGVSNLTSPKSPGRSHP